MPNCRNAGIDDDAHLALGSILVVTSFSEERATSGEI